MKCDRTYTVEQWEAIKEEGDDKRGRSQDFTFVWELQLYKPVKKKKTHLTYICYRYKKCINIIFK